jgi:hypothetical protein
MDESIDHFVRIKDPFGFLAGAASGWIARGDLFATAFSSMFSLLPTALTRGVLENKKWQAGCLTHVKPNEMLFRPVQQLVDKLFEPIVRLFTVV